MRRQGLGKRIALVLVGFLRQEDLGLGYAIAFSDLIIAPFTPSNTARSAGTIFPIIRNIPGLYGSAPGETVAQDWGVYHVDRLCNYLCDQFDVYHVSGPEPAGP